MDALWRRLKDLPCGKWLFSKIVGWRIPYTGTMGAIVQNLEPGLSEVRLPDRKIVRNHLDCIHAIALANLGEFTGGITVLGLLPPGTRFIITTLKIEYLKKARGTLLGRCRLPPLGDFGGEKSLSVVSEITNEAGELVARTTAEWLLRRDPKTANAEKAAT